MNEIEFIESIDACFPYKDERQWQALIKEGVQISDNASFMVLHEICRAPNEISIELQLKMLHDWEKAFDHPVKDLVIESGKAIIKGINIPVEKALEYLNQISKFKGLYNALAIVYFSCKDIDDKVSDLYNQIRYDWKNS
jgi:hypothetical protein